MKRKQMPIALRRLFIGLALLAIAGLALLGFAYAQALRDPVVRRAYVGVADWPAGEPVHTLLLVSDVHVAGPNMSPERLTRIVDRLNGLRPDIILLAGDFANGLHWPTRQYPASEIVPPLGRLRARLGVVAVLGNHDHWTDTEGFRSAFAAEPSIRLLANEATKLGPFVIGGVGDLYSGHADLLATTQAMDRLGAGPRLILTHSPDLFPLLPHDIAAAFAGHTHCGQVSLPFTGPLVTMSRHGRRFACGHIRDAGNELFVGAGLGTSLLPIRLGAPPDVWFVTFGPVRQAR